METQNIFSHANNLNKKYKFTINKSFKTNAEITPRTVEVADAFGVGIDDEFMFTIFNNFQIGFDDNDIVYITGDSGSGKSILLREIMNNLSQDEYIFEKDLIIKDNETLVEGLGEDLNTAIKILSIVGLNDAFLYLRRYNELSDGQKLRYRLAKMIASNKKIYIFDEFSGTLDRDTAKIISFNIQKYIRKNNKILIVATTHSDLKEDLCPNVYIFKKFNNDYNVEYSNEVPKSCSIVKNLKIERIDDVRRIHDLEKFHYRNEIHMFKSIYGLLLNDELVGCMIISYPLINLKGRNIFLNNKYSKSTSDTMKELNKEVEYISRVIVHPKFRGVGLAYFLIREYITNISTCKYIETIAVMAKYNPFFEKAGMKRIFVDKEDEFYDSLIKRLENIGFRIEMLKSSKYVNQIYQTLDSEKKKEFFEVYEKLFKRYCGISGGGGRFQTCKEMFDRKDLSLVKNLIESDIQYLVYDNTERFNKLNTQKTLF